MSTTYGCDWTQTGYICPNICFFVGKSLGFGSYSLSGMQVLVNITENQKEKPQLILNEKKLNVSLSNAYIHQK